MKLFVVLALFIASASCERFVSQVRLDPLEEGGRAKRNAKPISSQLEAWRNNYRLYWPKDGVKTGCKGDNDCCSGDQPCGPDEGDCEVGEGQCAMGYVCKENNCQVLHAGEENRGGYSESDDCCEERELCHGGWAKPGCCTADSPCMLGEGLCKADEDCASDLVCGNCGKNPHFGTMEKCCVFQCKNLRNLPEGERRGITCKD